MRCWKQSALRGLLWDRRTRPARGRPQHKAVVPLVLSLACSHRKEAAVWATSIMLQKI